MFDPHSLASKVVRHRDVVLFLRSLFSDDRPPLNPPSSDVRFLFEACGCKRVAITKHGRRSRHPFQLILDGGVTLAIDGAGYVYEMARKWHAFLELPLVEREIIFDAWLSERAGSFPVTGSVDDLDPDVFVVLSLSDERFSGLGIDSGTRALDTAVPSSFGHDPEEELPPVNAEQESPHERPEGERHLGPLDAQIVPRFAGFSTFARLPTLDEAGTVDVAIVGIPVDAGVTYRPGTRFGPAAVRQGSRLLRPYHPGLGVEPFAKLMVADAGDIACNPFSIKQLLDDVELGIGKLFRRASRFVAIGGDHTISLPLLRAINAKLGPPLLLHFDAHLDTWDTYFGERYTHGTPFRRAFEENLLVREGSVHIGVRGPLYSRDDLKEDAAMGFTPFSCSDIDVMGTQGIVDRVRERVGPNPVYISVDIDVLDPAHAPGTGTPEPGGLSTRELLSILRGLSGLEIVSADVVEVAPSYDHAEITAIAAAHVIYELVSMMSLGSELR